MVTWTTTGQVQPAAGQRDLSARGRALAERAVTASRGRFHIPRDAMAMPVLFILRCLLEHLPATFCLKPLGGLFRLLSDPCFFNIKPPKKLHLNIQLLSEIEILYIFISKSILLIFLSVHNLSL